MNKLTFNESIAYRMYYELKSDAEIERAISKGTGTIASWRKRRNLPSISINPRLDDTWRTYQDYHEVLNPEQSKQMHTFLIVLSAAGRKAVKAGVKPDVGHFMNVYSGRYKTEEEKKTEAMWQERERKRA